MSNVPEISEPDPDCRSPKQRYGQHASRRFVEFDFHPHQHACGEIFEAGRNLGLA